MERRINILLDQEQVCEFVEPRLSHFWRGRWYDPRAELRDRAIRRAHRYEGRRSHGKESGDAHFQTNDSGKAPSI